MKKIHAGTHKEYSYEYTIESNFSSRRIPRFIFEAKLINIKDINNKYLNHDIRIIEDESEDRVKEKTEYKIKTWIDKLTKPSKP
jgi:hypothetical protein